VNVSLSNLYKIVYDCIDSSPDGAVIDGMRLRNEIAARFCAAGVPDTDGYLAEGFLDSLRRYSTTSITEFERECRERDEAYLPGDAAFAALLADYAARESPPK
jgi:hypothetical protein